MPYKRKIKPITHCKNPNCGRKLSIYNKTGYCLHDCRKADYFAIPKSRTKAEDLLEAAETHFGLKIQEIFGSGKDADMVRMRKVIIYLLMTDAKLKETPVGKLVGRDRSTIDGMFNSAMQNISEHAPVIDAIRKLSKAAQPP